MPRQSNGPPKLLQDAPVDEASLELVPALEGEEVVHDYAAIGLTLRSHPLALLRRHLDKRRLLTAEQLLNSGWLRSRGTVTRLSNSQATP